MRAMSVQRLAGGPVRYCIDRSWCDQGGFFIEGRVCAEPHNLHLLRVAAGARSYDITRFAAHSLPPRADSGGGFALYMPWRAGEAITFEAVTDAGTWSGPILLPEMTEAWSRPFCLMDGSTDLPGPPIDHEAGGLVQFLTDFRACPDPTRERRVAEVGSRAVSRGWASMRPWFDRFADYIGVDIHPGENVGVVGDAYHLHDLIGAGTLDAVFSLSVMSTWPIPGCSPTASTAHCASAA